LWRHAATAFFLENTLVERHGAVETTIPREARHTLVRVARGVPCRGVWHGCHRPVSPSRRASQRHSVFGERDVRSQRTSDRHADPARRRWPWSDWSPFDLRRLTADLDRLRAFYDDRGFPTAQVQLDEQTLSEDGRSIRLRIVIQEGAPQRIGSVSVTGIETLPGELSNPIRSSIPAAGLGPGVRRDRGQLLIARSRILGLLRDQGYPHARVEIIETASDATTMVVELQTVSGPETYFGAISVVGLKKLKQVVVFRAVTFDPGDLYRESDVNKSQRRLANLRAFEFVNLTPQTEARDAKADVLPMTVKVAEARSHRFELRAGYGTEDRVHGSVEWRNLKFFGNASQLVATANDSTVLRGGGFGYEHPYLWPSGGSLSARAWAWWTHETTFTSRNAGGQVTVRHEFGRTGPVGQGVVNGWEVGGTYRNERLQYEVTAAALEDVGTVEERIALGLDAVTGRGDGTVAALEVDVTRTAIDTPGDPSKGSTVAIHLGHVAPWLAGTCRYEELLAEARGYVPIKGRVRLAAKLRAGTLVASDTSTIPFSARYFLGGSSSVRGWGRYEISPTSSAGVPVGGRTVVEASAEVRFPLFWDLGGVVFMDAGQVWPGQWQVKVKDLRYAAGGGLRWQTLIGVVRGDVGWQLNSITDLRINSQLQTRPWRIHLSIGHAF